MGRIKKVAGPRHEATSSPATIKFVDEACSISLHKLPRFLQSSPPRCMLPRGDLYHWIPLLNRFDSILEQVIREYDLTAPQTRSFESTVLRKALLDARQTDANDTGFSPEDSLDDAGLPADGDRHLVESVLRFSRMLLEHCGNRSLYASSERLDALLNTTDLSLLSTTLQFMVRLAQRYQASRQRSGGSNSTLNHALLASHYNVHIGKVQQLAEPFPLSPPPQSATTKASAGRIKGKEQERAKPPSTPRASRSSNKEDMLSVLTPSANRHDGSSSTIQVQNSNLSMDVLTWPEYSRPSPRANISPVRRPSSLRRSSASFSLKSEISSPLTRSSDHPDITPKEEPPGDANSTSIEPTQPGQGSRPFNVDEFAVFTRARLSSATQRDTRTRGIALEIRLLAVTNLAFVHNEETFKRIVLEPDSNEARHLQLIPQLVNVLHAAGRDHAEIPLRIQTIAIGTLEALGKLRSCTAIVCASLGVNLNHGVLFYLLRQAIAEMASDSKPEYDIEKEEWREAIFSLLDTLTSVNAQAGDALIGAGILELFVQIINMRTSKAERNFSKTLTFLNNLVGPIRDAFQTLANARGLEAIAELLADEVHLGITNVESGSGIAPEHKTQYVDFKVPYFCQQTLRMIFKIISQMMSNSSGNFDRLLRNLIDSSRLLAGLRSVITKPEIFGSCVWSGAVNIMSSFIHNEPTSYSIIAEAGLSTGLLETVCSNADSQDLEKNPKLPPSSTTMTPEHYAEPQELMRFFAQIGSEYIESNESDVTQPHRSLAHGILPSTDAIVAIPHAFGAICLKSEALEMFKKSNALEKFFEIFISPRHLAALSSETDLASLLGCSFDELTRHHPGLKITILVAILKMLRRVAATCRSQSTSTNSAEPGEDNNRDKEVEMTDDQGLREPLSENSATSSASTKHNSTVQAEKEVLMRITCVMKFIGSFLANTQLCNAFVDANGFSYIMDLILLDELPHSFADSQGAHEAYRVICCMADAKPCIILPQFVLRFQQSARACEFSSDTKSMNGRLSQDLSAGTNASSKSSETPLTHVNKASFRALAHFYMLTSAFLELYNFNPFHSRSAQSSFCSVNLADVQIDIVNVIIMIQQNCVLEHLLHQKHAAGQGGTKDTSFFVRPGSAMHLDSKARVDVDERETKETPSTEAPSALPSVPNQDVKDAVILRYLLTQVPSSLVQLLRRMSRSLLSKKRSQTIDQFTRQSAGGVASAIASACITMLRRAEDHRQLELFDDFLFVMTTSISKIMVDDVSNPQVAILVLAEFSRKGGIKMLMAIVDEHLTSFQKMKDEKDDEGIVAKLINSILKFCATISNRSLLVTSNQAIAATEDSKSSSFYFLPEVLLIDLHEAISDTVTKWWKHSDPSTITSAMSGSVIEMLMILAQETLREGQPKLDFTVPQRQYKSFPISEEKLKFITSKGFEDARGREALYRCLNNQAAALTYCQHATHFKDFSKLAIPSSTPDAVSSNFSKQARQEGTDQVGLHANTHSVQDSSSQDLQGRPGSPSDMALSAESSHRTSTSRDATSDRPAESNSGTSAQTSDDPLVSSAEDVEMSLNSIETQLPDVQVDEHQMTKTSSHRLISDDYSRPPQKIETIEKVARMSSQLRDLLNGVTKRALIFLASHPSLASDLASLVVTVGPPIQASQDKDNDIVDSSPLLETMVKHDLSKISPTAGAQLAALAKMSALLLQDASFRPGLLEDLAKMLPSLLQFVTLRSDHSFGIESMPWIPHILLLFECCLCEEAVPPHVEWHPPSAPDSEKQFDFPKSQVQSVDFGLKVQLLENLLSLMPHTKRDGKLVLAILRIVVMLTRDARLAAMTAEKKNIQRLFLMIKQLSGAQDDRITGAIMCIIRHMFENDELIRLVMVSEIRNAFDARQNRPLDVVSYARSQHALVIRHPAAFIKASDDLLEIVSYDPSQRSQPIRLKSYQKGDAQAEAGAIASNKAGDEDSTMVDLSSSKSQSTNAIKAGAQSQRDSGAISAVMQYLLTELLNYKDTDDNIEAMKVGNRGTSATAQGSNNVQPETEMVPPTNTSESDASRFGMFSSNGQSAQKHPRIDHESNPIHTYRCFILQTLIEMVLSYNSAKVEFLSFSRKPGGITTTPSKTRPSLLNYLLNEAIPEGPLSSNHSTLDQVKRNAVSNLAMSLLVSLCVKTSELGYDRRQSTLDESNQDDLIYARKLVLDNAIRVFKEIIASHEAGDMKFGRLADLSDLFSRLLSGTILDKTSAPPSGLSVGHQKLIAKMMLERNYIAILTNAVAELDLSMKHAERAIKYILRPLKQLTIAAIDFSQTTGLKLSLDNSEFDQGSTSANSISGDDEDEDREETPDLFRNSTLGIFEPAREEDASSNSSVDEDEEMYDDDYYENMEDEEDLGHDADEVISDEELEGMGEIEGLHGDRGMDVEVMINDEDQSNSMDEDDDDDDGEEEEDDDEDNDEDDHDHDEEDEDEDEDDDDDDELEREDERDQVLDLARSSGNPFIHGNPDDDDEEAGWEDEEDGSDAAGDNVFSEGDQPLHSALSTRRARNPSSTDPSRGIRSIIASQVEQVDNLLADISEGTYMDDTTNHRNADDGEEDGDYDEGEEEDQDDEEQQYDDEDLDDEYAYLDADEEEETDAADTPWGWIDAAEEAGGSRRRYLGGRRHRYAPGRQDSNRAQDAWTIFPSNGGSSSHVPHNAFRSHRLPSNGNATPDDGTNPLLLTSNSSSAGRPNRRASGTDITSRLFNDSFVQTFNFEDMAGDNVSSMSMISDMFRALSSESNAITAVPGPNGALHVSVNADSLPAAFQAAMQQRLRPVGVPLENPQSSARSTSVFVPQKTISRWAQEAKILFNSGEAPTKAQVVVNSLLNVLVPPAWERRKAQEESARLEKQKAEQTGIQEREERDRAKAKSKAATSATAEAAPDAARASQDAQSAGRVGDPDTNTPTASSSRVTEPTVGDSLMNETQDLQGNSAAHDGDNTNPETAEAIPSALSPLPQAESSTNATAQRQFVMFNGTRLDITDMGIDSAYLEALPEDIRNEVLMSQLVLQRAQSTVSGDAPTEIDNDFLEALPAEIRAELLQQEAQERRRRDREAARRRQQQQRDPSAAAQSSIRAEEMDPASFLASLDPQLRQNVLLDQLEQEDNMMEQLGADFIAEARNFASSSEMRDIEELTQLIRPRTRIDRSNADKPQDFSASKPQKKQVFQMLDRSGVAALLRLIFVHQHSEAKASLTCILHSVSENKQARADIVTLLLSILQEGSSNADAIGRSFSMLSSLPNSLNNTSLRRENQESSSKARNSDIKFLPLTVLQQCLSLLRSLSMHNSHVATFFLSENEKELSAKPKSSRKGKAKDSKVPRYPINTLLTLLERPMIYESTACVEQLSSLLQTICGPLSAILRDRRSKKAQERQNVKPSDSSDQNAIPTSDGTAAQTVEGRAEAQITTTSPESNVTPSGIEEAESSRNEPRASRAPSVNKEVSDITKRSRLIQAPVISSHNLGLVVNILTARECPSSTFRAALATMTHLCAVSGARHIFGRKLVAAAQHLSHRVLEDLHALRPIIQRATSGAMLHCSALSKFSLQTSEQAKFLRVLKTLDFIYDPQRADELESTKSNQAGDDDDTDTEGTEMLSSRAGLVDTLYEDETFGKLWQSLSECMTTLRNNSGLMNVATILLPLIEALMVVCTNSVMRESPSGGSPQESSGPSPSIENKANSLFFSFTEEHRKILNELVRHNPRLMNGTFQLLVKNPKVLEFDNKRRYFARRLHTRNENDRYTQPSLTLAVRREHVFLDSFKFLFFKNGNEIKYGKLNIRFHGEEGVDAGGVTREWFQVLSRQMFNPDYALFVPVASDRTTFHPNKLSAINEEHLMFFKFIGRIIGKALYEKRALDCHFSRAMYKRMLGKGVSIKDMETLDLDYYKSLLWMLENDITEIITENMCVETDDFGVTEVVDLVENGRNVPVNQENKHEYIQRVVEYRLVGSVQAQLEKFLEGFHDIVPPELISIFTEQELELLISGLPDIDVDDWKNHTEYHNYQASSPQIQWFWRAVRSFDKEERAKLLQFVTGTSKVPLNGFGELEGMNGFSQFNIHRDYGDKDRLPSSHTCFNQLDLPEYQSYEILRQRVSTAMTAGSEYFGFA